jgi:AraC family transcriptional regulator
MFLQDERFAALDWPVHYVDKTHALWQGRYGELTRAHQPAPAEFRVLGRSHCLFFNLSGHPLPVDVRLGGTRRRGPNPPGAWSLLPAGHELAGLMRAAPLSDYMLLTWTPELVADTLGPELGGRPLDLYPRFGEYDAGLHGSALKLRQVLAGGGPLSRLHGDVLTCALLVELAGRFLDPVRLGRAVRGGLATPALRAVLDYLEARLHEAVPLADLAALAGLSRAQFCRAFVKSTGLSPHRYQLARRVDRAKVMLREGDAPVHEIAASLGFSSGRHFSAYFRSVVGASPRDFRGRPT